jgi:glycosyltransferase involved in cell wall biosynthesis
MWNLHRTLAQDAEERMHGRVLYRFADYWPSLPSQYRHFWLAPGRRKATRWVRRILAPLALRLLERDDRVELSFPYAYCVSEAVRRTLTRKGIPASHASVIHTGLDLRPFEEKGNEDRWPPRASHRILYAGRLAPEKGVHILIEAISLLAHQVSHGPWKVKIAGGGEPGYVAELEEMVRKYGLLEEITFLGRVPAEAIPSLTQEHGIVVLPSLWEEPLPRMAIEGMASGCAVIASDVGGVSEIIAHERTGLLVPPGDPKSLAHALAKLATVPGLAQGIGEAGHASAHSRFRLDHMLDQVEDLLGRIARPALYEVGAPVSSA